MANPKSQIPNSKSQAADGSLIPDPGFPPEGDYCRDLESYLCRKNDGHLIRIVGPAFEQVCGWAARGIPLKLAMRGIDRYFERYYAKGSRRRPVRIEFCEADVLDVFDEWRRSVGVSVGAGGSGRVSEAGEASGAGEVTGGADPLGPRSTLPAHLDRLIARLTTLRGGHDRTLDSILDSVIRELDAARSRARTIRGEARDAFVERLHQLDVSLVEALRHQCDDATLRQLRAEADDELKPFRVRMPAEAYQHAHRACVDRLLRERANLPTIAYE
jgi:hypothetical protein